LLILRRGKFYVCIPVADGKVKFSCVAAIASHQTVRSLPSKRYKTLGGGEKTLGSEKKLFPAVRV
jgi:hypothetical protein